MAKIYYRRVVAGLMAVEDVPAPWRAQVRKLVDVIDGKS